MPHSLLAFWKDPEAAHYAENPSATDSSFSKLMTWGGVDIPQRVEKVTGRARQVDARKSTWETGKCTHPVQSQPSYANLGKLFDSSML